MKAWTMKEVNWLKANYRELGRKECAKRLGRTVCSVQRRAHECRLTQPYGATATLDTYGPNLLNNGFSAVDIAAELGVGYSTVRTWAKARGLRLRRLGGRVNQPRLARIIALLDEGFNGRQVADALGTHPTCIYDTLKRRGIAWKKRQRKEPEKVSPRKERLDSILDFGKAFREAG